MGALERRASRALVQVPGRLNGVEQSQLERSVDCVGLARAGGGETDRNPGVAKRPELGNQLGIVEHAALNGRRMDLIEVEAVSQKRLGLGKLSAEPFDTEILLLLHGSIHVPVAGVGIAPLRADHECVGVRPARRKPRRQKRLGQAV